jgi:uncharacterized protein YjbJ (UPF0337 family)
LGSDQGNWKQLKGQAKQRWGDLTDDDLDRVEGRQEELEGLLHERYRKTREEARREIDEWPGASDGADLDERSPASAGLFSAALAALVVVKIGNHVARVQGLDEPGPGRFQSHPLEGVHRIYRQPEYSLRLRRAYPTLGCSSTRHGRAVAAVRRQASSGNGWFGCGRLEVAIDEPDAADLGVALGARGASLIYSAYVAYDLQSLHLPEDREGHTRAHELVLAGVEQKESLDDDLVWPLPATAAQHGVETDVIARVGGCSWPPRDCERLGPVVHCRGILLTIWPALLLLLLA